MTNKYSSNLAFIDLLFNLILGFVFLFVVSFLMINEPEKKSEIEQKAEYIIVLDWDDESDSDIDLWVETPRGKVGFMNTQVGSVFLDKDDLGHRNDTYGTSMGSEESNVVHINREIVNIRGFEPGEYIVNAHFYGGRNKDGSMGNKNVADILTLTVSIYKLNPYSVVHTAEKKFSRVGQEETFARFTIKPDGTYKDVNTLSKKIVTLHNTVSNEIPSTVRQTVTGGF